MSPACVHLQIRIMFRKSDKLNFTASVILLAYSVYSGHWLYLVSTEWHMSSHIDSAQVTMECDYNKRIRDTK